MAEVKREHRETAATVRYPQAGVPAEGSWCRGWIEGTYSNFGNDEETLNAIAQALAEAEQQGAERERAAIVSYVREMTECGEVARVEDIEAGKHLEADNG